VTKNLRCTARKGVYNRSRTMIDQQNAIIAINQAKIVNRLGSYQTMRHVGPKVCIATVSHSGFLGFDQLLQIGIPAMAGRYGGEPMQRVTQRANLVNAFNGSLARSLSQSPRSAPRWTS
jgi:hypothetical protein